MASEVAAAETTSEPSGTFFLHARQNNASDDAGVIILL
jgi:hypothetical protein